MYGSQPGWILKFRCPGRNLRRRPQKTAKCFRFHVHNMWSKSGSWPLCVIWKKGLIFCTCYTKSL